MQAVACGRFVSLLKRAKRSVLQGISSRMACVVADAFPLLVCVVQTFVQNSLRVQFDPQNSGPLMLSLTDDLHMGENSSIVWKGPSLATASLSFGPNAQLVLARNVSLVRAHLLRKERTKTCVLTVTAACARSSLCAGLGDGGAADCVAVCSGRGVCRRRGAAGLAAQCHGERRVVAASSGPPAALFHHHLPA